MQLFYDLFSNVLNFTWQEVLMILTGGLLIYLAVKPIITKGISKLD